jgi:hypothetical protein
MTKAVIFVTTKLYSTKPVYYLCIHTRTRAELISLLLPSNVELFKNDCQDGEYSNTTGSISLSPSFSDAFDLDKHSVEIAEK